MRRAVSILFLAAILMSLGSPVQQKPDTRVRLKALMIFQFATQIDWPKKYKEGSFVVGIYGNDELFEAVKKSHSTKSVGNQPLKILKFSSQEEIKKCHILFIGEKKSSSVKSLVSKYKSSGTLVISEYATGLKDGAIINFVVSNNQNRYELSKTNAQKQDLVINSKIIGYAIGVK